MDAPSKSVPVNPSPGREAWAKRRRAMEGRREAHSPRGRKKRRERRLLGLAIKLFGLSLHPLGLYARSRGSPSLAILKSATQSIVAVR